MEFLRLKYIDPLLPVSFDIELLLFCTFLSLLAFCAEFSLQLGLIEAGIKDRRFDPHSSRAWDLYPGIIRCYGLVTRSCAYLGHVRAFLHPDASPTHATAS